MWKLIKHLLLIPAALVLVVGAVMPTANATTDAPHAYPAESEYNNVFDEYVSLETLFFDTERAESDGVAPVFLETGEVYNENLVLMGEECDATSHKGDSNTHALTTRAAAFDIQCLPIAQRWNWCGKCKTDGGSALNSADQACKNHDFCLGNEPTCDCDNRFVSALRRVRDQYSGADRAYIEAAIQLVPRVHGC